jgi:hypothetical protein
MAQLFFTNGREVAVSYQGGIKEVKSLMHIIRTDLKNVDKSSNVKLVADKAWNQMNEDTLKQAFTGFLAICGAFTNIDTGKKIIDLFLKLIKEKQTSADQINALFALLNNSYKNKTKILTGSFDGSDILEKHIHTFIKNNYQNKVI